MKGVLRIDEADFEAAAGILKDALVLMRDIGNGWGAAECLERLAEIDLASDQASQAVQLMAAADAACTVGGWLVHADETELIVSAGSPRRAAC